MLNSFTREPNRLGGGILDEILFYCFVYPARFLAEIRRATLAFAHPCQCAAARIL